MLKATFTVHLTRCNISRQHHVPAEYYAQQNFFSLADPFAFVHPGHTMLVTNSTMTPRHFL